ncbi:MAG: hypothetical protein RW306_16215 [Geobacteraceae bacterium]|nr:hypothetical protein [Geobacteraceae bacterium]
MTNKSHNYRIVLSFEGDDLEIYDRVVAIETKLEMELVSGEVNGHDVGGSVNIFIDSREPKICFEEAMKIIKDVEPKPCAAGYRAIEKEDYVRLWPQGDATPFELN